MINFINVSSRSLKTDAPGITKLDTGMFHGEFWTPVYFGVIQSKVKVTSHRNIAGVGHCSSVSAGCFQFFPATTPRRLSWPSAWLSVMILQLFSARESYYFITLYSIRVFIICSRMWLVYTMLSSEAFCLNKDMKQPENVYDRSRSLIMTLQTHLIDQLLYAEKY